MPVKFYRHMCLNYHTYSLIANSLIALSIAGLSLLGVLTTVLTTTALVVWAVLLSVLFGVGKLIDQEVDDLDKVTAHQGRCSNDKPNSDNSDHSPDSQRLV